MHRTTQMKLTDLNRHITCRICNGYFVDATTIAECLHSFCKSCIVTHLNRSKFCPICDVQVHKTKPLLNIRSDQTLQDIVYKLVPGLFQSEMNRRRKYYKAHPEYVPASNEDCGEVSIQRLSGTPEDSISLSLEYHPTGTPYHQLSSMETDTCGFQRRYLCCPAAVTIHHLKRLICNKFDLGFGELIDIMYTDDPLPDSNTLMDIAFIYAWRRHSPMRLYYRIHISGSSSKKRKLSLDAQLEDVPSVCQVKLETATDATARVISEPMEIDVKKEVAEPAASKGPLEKKKSKTEEVRNGNAKSMEAPKVSSEEEGNVVQLEISESGEMKAMKDGETVLTADKRKAQDLSFGDLIMRSVVSQFPSKTEAAKTSLTSTSSKVKVDGQKPNKSLNSSKTLPYSSSSLKSPTVSVSRSIGGSISKTGSSGIQPRATVLLKPLTLPETSPRSHIPGFSRPCTSASNVSISKPTYHGRATVANSSQSVTISPVVSMSTQNQSNLKSSSQSSPVCTSVPKSTAVASVSSLVASTSHNVSAMSSAKPTPSASNYIRSQSPQVFSAKLKSPQKNSGVLPITTSVSSQVASAIAGVELDRSFVPSASSLRLKGNTIAKQTHRSRLGSSKAEIPSVQMLNLNRTTHLSMTKSEPVTKVSETLRTSSESALSTATVAITTNANSADKDIVETCRVQDSGTPKKSAADVLMTITEKAMSKNCSSPVALANNYYSPVDSTDTKSKPQSVSQSEGKALSQKSSTTKLSCTNVSSLGEGTSNTLTSIASGYERKPKTSPSVQSVVTTAITVKPSISTSTSRSAVSSALKKSDSTENNLMPQDLSIVSKKPELKKPPSLKPIVPHPTQVVGTTKASIMSSKNYKSRNQPKFLGNPSERVRPMYPSSTQMSPSKQGGVLKVDPRTLNPVWGPHVPKSEQCKATATSAESLLSTTLLPNSLSCFPPYNGVGKPSLGGMSPSHHPSVTTQPLMHWSLMGAKAPELNLPHRLFSDMPHPSFIPPGLGYIMRGPPFSPTSVPPDVNRNYPTTSASSTDSKKIEKLTNGSVQQNA